MTKVMGTRISTRIIAVSACISYALFFLLAVLLQPPCFHISSSLWLSYSAQTPPQGRFPEHSAHRLSASLVTHPAWIRPQLCLLHPSKTCPSPGQLENYHRQNSQPVLVLNYTQTTISPKLSLIPSSEINPKLFYELLK